MNSVATITDIKERLLQEPEKIVELFEHFGFEHINLRSNEIRFARNAEGGSNISMRLQNNEWCNISDYARGYKGDIFSFISQEKNVSFREVLQTTKKILNLDDHWEPQKKHLLFGGIYSRINKQSEYSIKTYDENILDQYPKCGNLRFLKDHISLESQMKFGLRYNTVTQRILIPIRDIFGSLAGIKARRNYETDDENDPKYLYELPCPKTALLYGAHENYPNLMNADRIVIGESEKFTLACDSYGYNGAVSIMGSTLSPEQAKILLGFNAKEYCFMLDEGLPIETTHNNAKLLKSYAAMRECKITFFDWRDSLSVGDKESPTDGGKENFYYILNNEIKDISKLEEEFVEDEI